MSLIIGIVGGSGSGKTTVARALAARLGDQAAMIAEDSYYGDWGAEPDFDPSTFDFDDVAARDHDLLAHHLAILKGGGRVEVPVYSFVTHRRLAGESTTVGPVDVVIVEGLHLFCTPEVADQFDLKVFIDTPGDIRFIRRLIRDQAERDRSWESVVNQYLGTVRPAHLRQVEPSRTAAEIVILDEAGAVRLENPASVERLVAPLLADPRIKSIIG